MPIARIICIFACLSAATASPLRAAETAPRPNILFILADDLGWGDVDFHGGPVPTPNLNRLRKDSLELTRHYVQPVCTPTRAALLSGRYCSRFGVTTPSNARSFPWSTMTLPKALKSAGYETALFGKWHLGSDPAWGPNHFGFDESYGSLAGGVGPWDHRYKKGPFTKTWHRNEKLIDEDGHVTDLITDAAIGWLKSRNSEPFFLYLPYTAVHLPSKEPQEYLDRVPESVTLPSHREYFANVIHLDESVGKLIEALKETGMEENTLVVFSSDNGGSNAENNDTKYPADNYTPGPCGGINLPWRGQKGQVYEGGIRTPTLVRWPGQLKPGTFDSPLHISDWMPTFCALAGVELKEDPRWDGFNIWPVLTNQQDLPERDIYIVGPHFQTAAIQSGDWKLIARGAHSKAQPHPYRSFELYNLAEDPAETTDLSPKRPEIVERLKSSLIESSRNDRDAVAKD